MAKFFTLSFWFNMQPGELHFSGMLFFLILILASIAVIFLFRVVSKRKNNVYFKIWRGFNNLAITTLILSLFLLFFEYEGIFIFAARFWILVLVGIILTWLFFIYKDFKKIPEIKEEFERKKEFEKYIP